MSTLFEETSIKGMKLKNRFVRSATWEARATEEGRCTDNLTDFTVALARGGVALIVMGHAYILPNGRGTPLQTGLYKDELVDDLKRIPPRIHRYESRVALQISHAGGHTKSAWISGTMLAPSSFRNIYGETAEEMTASQIEEMTEAFAQAAKRAQHAGFDAVQIHAAHGYLVNQFLSPIWNHREDAYGGDLKNRARFLFEICQAIRRDLGDQFPVLIKLSSEDFIEEGFSIDESIWVASRLAEMGIDAIEVSGGSRYAALSHIPTGIRRREDEAPFAENACKIKNRTSVPVMLVGGIRSYGVAEDLIRAGKADYISMSRPFICEPGLVNRWKSGRRSKAKCISDGLCLAKAFQEMGVRCQTKQQSKAGLGNS